MGIIDPHFHNTIDLARALGGEVTGDEIRAPGPGHSAEDRSLSVKVDPGARDGFIVYSHAGDDWQECRDYVRERVGLGAFKPNGQGRKRPSSTASKGPRVVDKTHDYKDEGGSTLYSVKLLALINADPKATLASLATKMEWKLFSGEPNKMKVARAIKGMKKLVTQTRAGNYKLTDEGEVVLKGEK